MATSSQGIPVDCIPTQSSGLLRCSCERLETILDPDDDLPDHICPGVVESCREVFRELQTDRFAAAWADIRSRLMGSVHEPPSMSSSLFAAEAFIRSTTYQLGDGLGPKGHPVAMVVRQWAETQPSETLAVRLDSSLEWRAGVAWLRLNLRDGTTGPLRPHWRKEDKIFCGQALGPIPGLELEPFDEKFIEVYRQKYGKAPTVVPEDYSMIDYLCAHSLPVSSSMLSYMIGYSTRLAWSDASGRPLLPSAGLLVTTYAFASDVSGRLSHYESAFTGLTDYATTELILAAGKAAARHREWFTEVAERPDFAWLEKSRRFQKGSFYRESGRVGNTDYVTEAVSPRRIDKLAHAVEAGANRDNAIEELIGLVDKCIRKNRQSKLPPLKPLPRAQWKPEALKQIDAALKSRLSSPRTSGLPNLSNVGSARSAQATKIVGSQPEYDKRETEFDGESSRIQPVG